MSSRRLFSASRAGILKAFEIRSANRQTFFIEGNEIPASTPGDNGEIASGVIFRYAIRQERQVVAIGGDCGGTLPLRGDRNRCASQKHVQPKDLVAPSLWPVSCTSVGKSAWIYLPTTQEFRNASYFSANRLRILDGIARERDQP
jgi:hypothetical protein